MESADQSAVLKRLQSQLNALKVEKERLKSRLNGLVEKVDPLLLLLSGDPRQTIRQICQQEMARYGLIDSYTRNRG